VSAECEGENTWKVKGIQSECGVRERKYKEINIELMWLTGFSLSFSHSAPTLILPSGSGLLVLSLSHSALTLIFGILKGVGSFSLADGSCEDFLGSFCLL